jgi:cytochrome c biogenesis protein CcdA
VLLLFLGILLLIPKAQLGLTIAAGPFGNWVSQRFRGGEGVGLRGQFGIGLLLGTIWSPCAGPTLGTASLLASQGKDLGHVALVMLMFGLGTALPLLVLGFLSRASLVRLRGRMLGAGSAGKMLLGGALVAVSLLMVTGLDHPLESYLVQASPPWLTAVTTQF